MTLSLHSFGSNDTIVWGMSSRERTARMALAQKLTVADAAPASGALIAADLGFAFDPQWLRYVIAHPGTAITSGGRIALAHLDVADLPAVTRGESPASLTVIAVEDGIQIENEQLRKRETPFLLPLTPASRPAVERASYKGSYKGVTDLLTKYLWPELAFHMTRAAAALRMTPNMVTLIGIALCVAATFAFWDGHYWPGLAMGFVFMVLDTVDGKLARCTITSSKIGDILDHGTDLVHPPFWWWAWIHGLAAYGRPIPEKSEAIVLAAIVGGYVVQRLIEGAFMRSFGKQMHIHVWRPIDSWFRLITARRNPNVVILVAALLAGRPDIGIVAVAWWTILSCAFHAVRLVQAWTEKMRGRQIVSWLS